MLPPRILGLLVLLLAVQGESLLNFPRLRVDRATHDVNPRRKIEAHSFSKVTDFSRRHEVYCFKSEVTGASCFRSFEFGSRAITRFSKQILWHLKRNLSAFPIRFCYLPVIRLEYLLCDARGKSNVLFSRPLSARFKIDAVWWKIEGWSVLRFSLRKTYKYLHNSYLI